MIAKHGAAAASLFLFLAVWVSFSQAAQQPDLILHGFNQPYAVAVDPVSSDLYVADTGNNRVLRFTNRASLNSASPPVTVFGQQDFTSTYPNQNGAVNPHTLSSPRGVGVDGSGSLWVSDSLNNRVVWYHNASSLGNGPAANGAFGQPNLLANHASCGPLGLNNPIGIFPCVPVEYGENVPDVWISDSGNNRYRQLCWMLSILFCTALFCLKKVAPHQCCTHECDIFGWPAQFNNLLSAANQRLFCNHTNRSFTDYRVFR